MDFSDNSTEPLCMGSQRDSLYVVIPITVIYVTIFVTGTIGNISTCIVVARNKVMHTATNYYLFSLAISDLVLLFSGLPQEIYIIWYKYPYIFGSTFCFLRGLLAETSGNATVLTITAFTVERYLAICHPFLSHTMSKLSRAIKLILLIWILAIGLAIPQAIPLKILGVGDCTQCTVDMDEVLDHIFEVSTFLFFMAPMSLITVLYILIAMRLKSSRMMKKKISTNARMQSKSSRKVVKMLVSVVVAFFICWAPFHIQRVYCAYNRDYSEYSEKVYIVVTYISGVLYYLATAINPILYNIMSVKFREAFKETFSRCCGIGHLHHGRPQRSYSVLSKSKVRGPDSTDSGSHDPTVQTNTSLTHKNSADSFNGLQMGMRGYKPQRSFKEHGGIQEEITMINQKSIPTAAEHQPQSTMSSPSLLNNPTCLSVHVSNPNPSTLTKFLQFFHCIAKKTLDDSKRLSSYYSSPVKETNALELQKTGFLDKEKCDNGVRKPCISNSSLKNIEIDAIEDELTAYMKEIRKREANS
ncbi:pyrokinin-1 receptor-like [Anoplophora glabripennis]|uniref:pyrokinin-1 receptor-like n=1 Tax=Anoplophora glabripennis TaxID=217634 RepID=UPI0008748F29|nr:pyrokinin-1 receptor-like [Anoplophora glabripennis]